MISLTTPGTHVEPPAVAARLATITNDAFAACAHERRGRFVPLATLPLCDPAASVKEFRARDRRSSSLPGAMLFSNVNGIGLDDEQFWPLYEAANDRGAVLMIHPTYPVGVEAMREYWLMPLNGFLFDTTLAASKLVFSGVVKRYPRIRWVLGHLGGTIPYLAERLDRGWRAFKECRAHIDEPPTAYLKRHFWYDTVNFAAGPAEAGDRVRRRRPHPRRQRLPAHDRQHPADARGASRAADHRRRNAPASSAATRSAC